MKEINSEYVMFAAEIMTLILKNAELAAGPDPEDGYRRAYYFHSGTDPIEIAEKIAGFINKHPASESG